MSELIDRSVPIHILVIGGGVSATAFVAAIRARGYEESITVVSAESDSPYDRPPLTKELFTRDEPSSLFEQFGPGSEDAEWVLDTRATKIEVLVDEIRVEFEDEPPVTAGGVVLATGVEPVVPAGWGDVLTISSWYDAKALRLFMEPGRHLGIVGAGWLGLELASSAAAAGCRVTLVDMERLPLGHVLPPEVSERIAGWIEDAGITFHGGHPVTSAKLRTIVTDEMAVICDVVVAALGARPRTEWLPPIALLDTGHVWTDTAGRTALRDVWAIGDVAAPYGNADQHWNAAVASAERTAAALMGREPAQSPTPTVFSTMFGRDLDVVGWPRRDLDVVWRGEGEAWTALMHEGGVLHAGLVVGRPRDVADLRRLLRDGPREIDIEWAVETPRLRLPSP